MNRFIVSLVSPDGQQRHAQLVHEGMTHVFSVVSPFLVSAGQTVDIGVRVQGAEPAPEPGSKLVWWRGSCVIKFTHDMSYLPSNRPLWAILKDVADHTDIHPSHGAMCVCMDQYAREIRLHLRRAMPPDRRAMNENWPQNESLQDINARFMAESRIYHVLQMVLRNF